jgi:hypothetical protein
MYNVLFFLPSLSARPRLYLGIFSSRAGSGQAKEKPDAKNPSPTVGPKFSAQARPMEAIFYRAFGSLGQAFLKLHVFLAQARPS